MNVHERGHATTSLPTVPGDQVFGKRTTAKWGLHIDVSTIKGLIIFVRCRHISSVRGCMTTQGDPIQIVAAY